MNKLVNAIKQSKITLAGDGEGDIPIQQISALGKTSDTATWFPFGMHANLPIDTPNITFSMSAEEAARVSFGGSPKERIKNIAEGEMVLYHPKTQSKIQFKDNGDIEIDVKNNAEITIAGACNITVQGDINLTAANVNIDAMTTNLGVGGPAIARLGDAVQVNVIGGSSSGIHNGTITGASANNTSI